MYSRLNTPVSQPQANPPQAKPQAKKNGKKRYPRCNIDHFKSIYQRKYD